MPLQRVAIAAGVNTMVSPTANEGGWSDGHLVRFRQGLAEKWRGWRLHALDGGIEGTARALLSFQQLAGDTLLAIATEVRLYVEKGGHLADITPVERTLAVAAGAVTSFNTTDVLLIDTGGAHGMAAGHSFTFDTYDAAGVRVPAVFVFGGIDLAGQDFQVGTVTSPSSFTVTTPHVFGAGDPPGLGISSVAPQTLSVYLPAGAAAGTAGLGWGADGFGITAWNQPAAVAAGDLPMRLWSLDSWGQTLLAAPTRGRLYAWSPDVGGGLSTRGVFVSNPGTPAAGPPLIIGGMMVGMPERHAVLFGASALNSEDAATYDPLLVRWSEVEDYTAWQATATNAAGSFRLQGGGRIVGWQATSQQTLVWTDQAVWAMRFVGMPFVYSFSKLAGNCGLIAQNAHADLGGVVFWMGHDAFWAFTGAGAQQLVCPLHDTVFEDLNLGQADRITCGTIAANGEVLWFYPSADSPEVDRYIVYNPAEQAWYGGALARTAWIDRGSLPQPVGAAPGGLLYDHEQGVDADGQPMGEWIQSGYFDLGDGEQLLFVSGLIPDFQDLDGSLSLTIRVTDYPNRAPRVLGPFTVTPETLRVPFRCRGRQASLRIDGGPVGADWRLGAVRVNIQPDGLR